MLFIGSCSGTFYAVEKKTGKLRWSYNIRKDGRQRSFHGDPLITGDLILIGTDYGCENDGVGHAYAFERESGKLRWKYRSTSVPTNVVQIGQSAYFGNFQDEWFSVKLQDGSLNWSFSTGASNESCEAIKSAVADETRLFLIGLDGVIYSLNDASGKVEWKRKLSASPTTSLALHDKTLYVGCADNRIYRLDSKNGEVISHIAVEAKPIGKPLIATGSLYMFLENRSERAGYIVSVSPKLDVLRWSRKSSPDWASERPHLWKGLIVAGNCRGEVYTFRASDGSPQWTEKLAGCIRSIGSDGDLLFVGVQEGMLFALDARSKK